jgi:hypothetical protein
VAAAAGEQVLAAALRAGCCCHSNFVPLLSFGNSLVKLSTLKVSHIFPQCSLLLSRGNPVHCIRLTTFYLQLHCPVCSAVHSWPHTAADRQLQRKCSAPQRCRFVAVFLTTFAAMCCLHWLHCCRACLHTPAAETDVSGHCCSLAVFPLCTPAKQCSSRDTVPLQSQT